LITVGDDCTVAHICSGLFDGTLQHPFNFIVTLFEQFERKPGGTVIDPTKLYFRRYDPTYLYTCGHLITLWPAIDQLAHVDLPCPTYVVNKHNFDGNVTGTFYVDRTHCRDMTLNLSLYVPCIEVTQDVSYGDLQLPPYFNVQRLSDCTLAFSVDIPCVPVIEFNVGGILDGDINIGPEGCTYNLSVGLECDVVRDCIRCEDIESCIVSYIDSWWGCSLVSACLPTLFSCGDLFEGTLINIRDCTIAHECTGLETTSLDLGFISPVGTVTSALTGAVRIPGGEMQLDFRCGHLETIVDNGTALVILLNGYDGTIVVNDVAGSPVTLEMVNGLAYPA
jgi:hypothetical protein